MIPYFLEFLATVILLAGAGAGVYFFVRAQERSRKNDAKTVAAETIQRAKDEAESIRREAETFRQGVENRRREAELQLKEKEIKQNEEIEQQARKSRQQQAEREKQLDKRQDAIDKQAEEIRKQERLLETTQLSLTEKIEHQKTRNAQLDKVYEDQIKKLHEISGLSKEEATRTLLTSLETTLHDQAGSIILKHEKLVSQRCEEQARNILLLALQRYAASHTAESTTSTVDIPNDDMKGRIIGREGRNIRAFEKITGVDVIIDDTPGVVIVSAFDSIRREIARLTLNRLIADGRIHPSRIEEIFKETDREIIAFIRRAGAEAVEEVDVHGLHERLVEYLGRLYFRTSYSQNVLRHSIEVAFLSGIIAVELGLDQRLARRCGLLHDIGKAVDHEVEGGHPKIGADLLKRYGEPFEVVQAALGHHDDPKIANPYTVIVAAADACSASRPGARRETLEHYVQRMEELEAIANEFNNVEQAYAVRAGREMRVLVQAEKTTDESAAKTCHDIVEALSSRLQFPGEIKVTVIRETRTTAVAK